MDAQFENPVAFQAQEIERVVQLNLLGAVESTRRFEVAIADEVNLALGRHAPVFMAVSGGKDSEALAHGVCEYLNTSGPPRIASSVIKLSMSEYKVIAGF